MAIRGELLSADLSNVLQMLGMNRKRGRLTVQEQGNLLHKRRLYLAEDRVAMDEALPGRPVIALLVEMDVLSYDDWRDVLSKADLYNGDPTKILRQKGTITDDDLLSAHRRVEEEGVLEVFLWRNIAFELDEEAPDARDGAHSFVIDTLIMEAARRQDEWAQYVEPDRINRQIYACLRDADPEREAGLDAIHRIVLDHVDGVRGSPEIQEATGLPRYFVDLSLRALVDQEEIRPLQLQELVTAGDRLVAAGRMEAGLRLFRTALQYDRRNVTLHRRLGQTYLEVGRVAKACAHFRFCAMSLMALGKSRDAFTIYRNVLMLLPTDFRTLEHLLQMLATERSLQEEDPTDLIELGRKLLSFYVETSQVSQALHICENLIALLPDDDELMSLQARLALKSGDRGRAIETWSEQAQQRERAGKVSAALDLYRTLMSVDVQNRHLYQARIADLQRRLEGVRRGKSRSRAVKGILLCLAVAGGLYGFWAFRANAAYESLQADLVDSKGKPLEASQAIAKLEAFATKWSMTPASQDANARCEKLRNVIEVQVETTGQRRKELIDLQARLLREADTNLAMGRSLRRQGNLVEARGALEKALESAASLQVPWEHLALAKEEFESIDEYVKEARRHSDLAVAASARGDRREAWFHLSKVAREYYLAPGCKDIDIPLRITSLPPTAEVKVYLPGGVTGGQGPHDISIAANTPFSVEVTAPGFHTVRKLIEPKESPWLVQVVMDRVSTKHLDLEQPLAALVPLPGSVVGILASNGRVTAARDSSLLSGNTPSWTTPRNLISQRKEPARNRDNVVVATETGLFRRLSGTRLSNRWEVRLPSVGAATRVVAPQPCGKDWLVAAEGGRGWVIARLADHNGKALWEHKLSTAPVNFAGSPQGCAVILVDGSLLMLDASTGKPRRTIAGTHGGKPMVDHTGRLLVHRMGQGLLHIPWNGEGESVILPFVEPLEAGPVELGGRILCAVARKGLVIAQGGGQTTLPVGPKITGIIDGVGSDDRVGVKLEGGRVLVADLNAKAWIIGARGTPELGAFDVLTAEYLILAAPGGRISVVPIN